MPRSINEVQEKVQKGEYRFSDHAVKRMIQRSIEEYDVEEAILGGEMIEAYPEDKYFPSCLIHGETKAGRNLHIQASFPPEVVIVTLYEPDPEKWIDYRIRRR